MELFFDVLEILAILAIILLNGFFVAAEFAIVKVRATQIEPLVKSGQKRAKLAQHVITHLDVYISTTQLGITVTSLALGWVGEPFVARLIAPLFALAGIVHQGVLDMVAFAAAFAVITYTSIVLGELAPKSLAIRYAQPIALFVAGPLHWFYTVFRPFIVLLRVSAGGLLRLFGFQPVSESTISHSEEELRLLLSREKVFSVTGKNILLNAMDLHNRTVREIMVPRTSVVFLSTQLTLEENIAIAVKTQFTRFPLCERGLDSVLGMIHLKDLFLLRAEMGSGTRLLEIKREMLFVPETMPLERILNTFLTKRILMAVAVDEYGGAAGLVTLENVLEEIVGDIHDEFDVEQRQVQKISDVEYLVDGSMPLHEFARMFNVEPESKDVVTVSGYAIQLLGRVPERGAHVRFPFWDATVEAVEGRRVKTLRMKRSAIRKGDGA
jgi:CBS domain containing-hemolysin-like protein